MEEEQLKSSLASQLRTLLYSCLLIKATKPHISNPLIYSTNKTKHSHPHLKASRISLKAITSKLKEDCEPDFNSLVFVGPKEAISLELLSGQWYEGTFHLKGEIATFKRWIRVFISPDVREKHCQISPILYHNLVKDICEENEKIEIRVDFNGFLDVPESIRKIVTLWDQIHEPNLTGPQNKLNLVNINETGLTGPQNTINPVNINEAELNGPRKTVNPVNINETNLTGPQNILNPVNINETELTGHRKTVNPVNIPQIASEIHIKAIESARYKCIELESLLKNYFRVPKITALGDIIALPVPSHRGFEFTPSNSIIPPKFVFIKVTKAKTTNKSSKYNKSSRETSQCVRVMVGETDLYLSGTVHSLVPSISENFDCNGEEDMAPLLKKTVYKLKSILQSELQEGKKSLSSIYQTEILAKNQSKSKPSKNNQSTPERGQKNKPLETKLSQKNHEKTKLSLQNLENITTTATILLLGPPGSGKREVIRLTASSLGLGVVWVNCWMLKGDTSGGTEARLRQTFVRASAQGPCILALLNVHCISKNREGEEDVRVVSTLREELIKLSQLEPRVFLVATAPDRNTVSDDLWSVWSHQEAVTTADAAHRGEMLKWHFKHDLTSTDRVQIPTSPQIQPLAQRTAGYTLGDFEALLNSAWRHCLLRIQAGETSDICLGSLKLTHNDLLKALDEMQGQRSDALGAPRIPHVKWGEVGGLEEAKREIVNTIQLPLKHPALVSAKLRRSGVLLYGPPGTGKTLLAKAVATECGLNFMSVKGPELLNMYVGQSEENVRQVFSRAKEAAPCVIFFDELDSLAPNRGRSGDSGGVMDRIVSSLLAELDGVSAGADVFVLGATNRPDLLDPALLRPGRFEKLVFLGVCEDREGQVKILRACTSKMPLSSTVELHRVAQLLPLTLTGADLHALCSDALYSAIRRAIEGIERKVDEKVEFEIDEGDFREAVRNLVPSVSPRELLHYKSLENRKQR